MTTYSAHEPRLHTCRSYAVTQINFEGAARGIAGVADSFLDASFAYFNNIDVFI